MKFSEQFGIQRSAADDWFDPILTVDTPLFVDPFLVYADDAALFVGSHDEIIAFFNWAFTLIAQSGGNPNSLHWKRAVTNVRFPEVPELCLGYTGVGVRGSGSGAGLATTITEALWESIQAGVSEITHFEEIGILREGIGADRISDITACLLRRRLSEYTAALCHERGVQLTAANYRRGYFDENNERWAPLNVHLPNNPHSGTPIVLVPRRYLRELPTISASTFFDYCFENENETLRNEVNADILGHVDKQAIVEFARNHPDIRGRYLEQVEHQESESYDFERDKAGLVHWYDATKTYCLHHALALQIGTNADFRNAIDQMLGEFRNYVENNEGWRLLWNENGTPRREQASQLLFLGVVKHYCKANNIDISREANIGRGPVDFKVAQGYTLRALLEVKLARNSRFWNGLRRQLPKYQEAEGIELGYFVVVVYSEADLNKIAGIQNAVEAVNQETGYAITPFIIDARQNPPPASRL